MTLFHRARLCLVLAVGLAPLACSDSSTAGGGSGTPGLPDAGHDVIVPADPGPPPDTAAPDTQIEEGDKIDFKDAACKGLDRCTVIMSYNEKRTLEVVVTRAAKPLEGATIAWKIVKNPNNSLKLDAFSTLTGVDGVSGNGAAQTAAQTNQYEVTAKLGSSDKAPTLTFDIAIAPKGQVPLTVNYTYKGKRKFDGITTLLFKQSPQGTPKCATVDLAKDTADTQSQPKPLPGTATFLTLPDLEKDKTQTWTIVGVGKDAGNNKPTIVYGCNDVDGVVTLDKAAKVGIELKDVPPTWKGSYTVTTLFDLVSVLPDTAEDLVNIVLGLFTDPAGQLMVLACKYGGSVSVLQDLCGFVFNDPANPCLEKECFKTVGLTVKNLLDAALNDLLKDNLGGTILFTGKDVAKILKELHLVSTFQFKNEPQADGTFTTDDTHAEWHTLKWRWSYGTDCPPEDDLCALKSLNISAFQGENVTAQFSGKVDYSTGAYLLHVDKHSLNIKYGKLLKFLIENEILPLITGGGPDDPVVDSFDELIKSLLGGKDCLKPGGDCCKSFADNIANSQTGTFNDIAEIACKALVDLAVKQLDEWILGLDVDTGDNFTIATKEACLCEDTNLNMTIDAWGQKTAPCHWASTVKVGGYESLVDNDFWAVEQD